MRAARHSLFALFAALAGIVLVPAAPALAQDTAPLWSATLTAGGPFTAGYSSTLSVGSLSASTFVQGTTTFTVTQLHYSTPDSSFVTFEVEPGGFTATGLSLKIGSGTSIPLSEATETSSASSVRYMWQTDGDNPVQSASDVSGLLSAQGAMIAVCLHTSAQTCPGDTAGEDPPDVTVSFGADAYTVAEGAGVEVTVVLSADPERSLTVPLTAVGQGGALASTDYTAPESVTFASGQTSATVTVTAAPDTVNDDGEGVRLGFGGSLPTGVTAGSPSAATVTIEDDDDPSVTVSFGASAYTVAEGADVKVTVVLSADPERTLAIPLTAAGQGGALASTDYTVPESVTFASGQTSATVTFSATADPLAKGDRTVTLGFGMELPDGVSAGDQRAATVTIKDSSLLQPSDVNKELLPRITQAMISSTLSAIASRIETADTGLGETGLAEDFALEQALTILPSAAEQGSPALKRALAGKSFSLPLNDTIGGLQDLAVWGGSDYRDMEGGGDRPIKWDGDLLSIHLGADVRLRPDILTGLAVSWSEGDFDYQDQAGSERGRYENEMVSVHPYLSLTSLEEDMQTWFTLGYGRGEVNLEDDSGKHSSDTRLKTAAAGLSGQLYTVDGLLGYSGTTTVRFKVDGHLSEIKTDGGNDINPLTSDIERVRVALEGVHECPLDNGRTLRPIFEIGLRHDSGDGLEGTAVEISAGMHYTDPQRGLTAEGRSRYLMSHSDDYDEWGFSGEIRVDPGTDHLGLAFSLIPSWGEGRGDWDRLWAQNAGRIPALNRGKSSKGRVDAQVDYGLLALGGRGVTTLYGRLSMGNGSEYYRLGSRLELGPSFNLNFEGGHMENSRGSPDHSVQIWAGLEF